MVYPATPHLFDELETLIHQRTGWRVRNLTVEVLPERTVLRGQATTPGARRLAQQVAHDYLPHLPVDNSIAVDDVVEILPGIPLN